MKNYESEMIYTFEKHMKCGDQLLRMKHVFLEHLVASLEDAQDLCAWLQPSIKGYNLISCEYHDDRTYPVEIWNEYEGFHVQIADTSKKALRWSEWWVEDDEQD